MGGFKTQVEELNQKNNSLKTQVEELNEKNNVTEQKLTTIKEENAAIKEENAVLLIKITEYEQKLTTMTEDEKDEEIKKLKEDYKLIYDEILKYNNNQPLTAETLLTKLQTILEPNK